MKNKQAQKSIFLKYVVVGMVSFFAIFCGEKTLRLASGFVGGTYFQVADSLKQLPEFKGFILVESTGGSKDNIQKIQNGDADLGITQLDILENMTMSALGLKDKIKAVLPLYNEEVHIIASKKIKSIAGLNGKKVNIGPPNSGTAGTAGILFKAFEILDVQADQSSTADALQMLLDKKLDAVIITAGAPVALLSGIEKSASKKIHLLPISKKTFEKLHLGSFHYGSASIPANTYPWQPEAVETLIIPSVLVADSSVSKASVEKLVNGILNNLDKLQEKHAKWKSLSKEYAQGFYQINKDLFHKGAAELLESN